MYFGDDHCTSHIRHSTRSAGARDWRSLGLSSAVKLCALILLGVGVLMASNSTAAQNSPLQDWLDGLRDEDFEPQQYAAMLPEVPLDDEQRENLKELTEDFELDSDTRKLTAKDVIEAPGKLVKELDSELQLRLLTRLVLDQMAVDSFGGPGGQEVLVLRPYGQSMIYSADGGSRELKWSRSSFLAGPVAWDYDRDGVDELLPRKLLALPKLPEINPQDPPHVEVKDKTPQGHTPVFSLGGREIAKLDGVVPQGQCAVTFDYDGDGWDELVLAEEGCGTEASTVNFRVLGRGGELLWTFRTTGSQRLMRGRYGDPSMECVYSYETGEVLAYHPSLPGGSVLEDWPPGAVPSVALGAREDAWPVVASGDGFMYDTWSMNSSELSLSAPAGAYMLFGEPKQRLAAGAFSQRSRAELAYCPYFNNPRGELRFYDREGSLTRQFELGEEILRIATVESRGQELLAVQTYSGVRFLGGPALLAQR
ncbi:hypothetical protein IT575_11470 [bacterium]|nr:hypothetical protein [bacterium]